MVNVRTAYVIADRLLRFIGCLLFYQVFSLVYFRYLLFRAIIHAYFINRVLLSAFGARCVPLIYAADRGARYHYYAPSFFR